MENNMLDEEIFYMPEGLEIRVNAFGENGLFASKPFKKGDIICNKNYYIVPYDNLIYNMTIKSNNNIFKCCNIQSHSTFNKYNNTRILYTWDIFMNHSCDANTKDYDNIEYINEKGQLICNYNITALRDISINEEITTNYLYFEYDADFNSFDCQCGSPICYKTIKGFKYLNKEDQEKIFAELNKVAKRDFEIWLKLDSEKMEK